MRRTFTLADGTKLVTASGCRYVTFYVHADGTVGIYKRTSSTVTAGKNHGGASHASCRVVTVDMVDGVLLYDRPPRRTDAEIVAAYQAAQRAKGVQ